LVQGDRQVCGEPKDHVLVAVEPADQGPGPPGEFAVVAEVVGAAFGQRTEVVVEQRGQGGVIQAVKASLSSFCCGVVGGGEGVGHGGGPQLPVLVGVGQRSQVAEQVRAAPGVQGGEVVVAGVAVTDQYAGEGGQHPTVVDVGAGPAADVHQGQIFGAGDMHVGQGVVGAAGGFIGVQYRRGGQQLLQVGQEGADQLVRGASAGAGALLAALASSATRPGVFRLKRTMQNRNNP